MSTEFEVELIDEVSKPAKNATNALERMMASYRKMQGAAGKLGGSMGGLQSKFSALTSGTSRLRAGLSSVGGGLASAGSAIAGFAAKAGVALAAVGVAGAAAFGKATVGAIAFREDTLRSLTMITKSADKAASVFRNGIALSDKLGKGVKETVGGIQRLMAKGFGEVEAQDIFKGMSDLKTIIPTANLENAVLAIEQIKGKGVLSMEELQGQLAEAGLNVADVIDQLGMRFGKSSLQVRKMISEGLVGADDGVKAILGSITKMTGKQLGEATAEASMGVSGMIERFKNLPERLMTELSGRFDASGLSGELNAMWEDIGPGSETFGKVLDGLVAGIKMALPMIRAFGSAFVGGFKEAWPAISQALGGIMKLFGGGGGNWLGVVKAFASVLGKVAAFAIGVAAVFGGILVVALAGVVGTVELLIGAWDWLIAAIGKVAFEIDNFIMDVNAKWERFKTDAITAAKNFIAGLVEGIRSGAQWVVDAVKTMAGHVVLGFKTILGIASPSKVMAEMGGFIGEGLEQGINRSMPTDALQITVPEPLMPKMAGMAAPKIGRPTIPDPLAPAMPKMADVMLGSPMFRTPELASPQLTQLATPQAFGGGALPAGGLAAPAALEAPATALPSPQSQVATGTGQAMRGAAAAGITVSVGDVHVTVDGDVKDPEQTGQQVGKAAARTLRSELEDLVLEAGS